MPCLLGRGSYPSTWPSSRSLCAILVRVRGTEGQAAQRLDSEQFRFAPRTSRPLCGRLMVRYSVACLRSRLVALHAPKPRGGSPHVRDKTARVHHAAPRRAVGRPPPRAPPPPPHPPPPFP